MTRLIAVCGATGNQGGSVAKLLLRFPEEYSVRALTRDPDSRAAAELAKLGATIVRADLTIPSSLNAALDGCWGVFGVTNFYDVVCSTQNTATSNARGYLHKLQKIKDDPSSEEIQGKNLAKAALEAGVQCFVWSTLPSSAAISGGRLVSRIYEGSFHTRKINNAHTCSRKISR
jgi:uncharacterized protein YbjT (DUF2867 family)